MISLITINSSSKSSTSSAKPVSDIITEWGNNPVHSCVLGISKISFLSEIMNKISHAALLLLPCSIDYESFVEEKMNKEFGILLEYGDYNPNMCDTEKGYTKKGLVKYLYEDEGGLRYYGKSYGEFLKEFATIGYIEMNISSENHKTFHNILETITNNKSNKWIQSKYSLSYNCQTFVIEALKVIKPYYNISNIFLTGETKVIKNPKLKVQFIPPGLREELKNYYKK